MPHPVDVYVGQRIRQRRWLLKMTQQQLAAKASVAFQQIQKYEKGSNRISASRLQEIAVALDVPVSFFFEGLEQGEGGPTHERPAVPDNKEAVRLLNAYCRIPKDQRRRLFGLACMLADVRPEVAESMPGV